MTKMAEKSYPWGRTYLYSPYKEVLSPGGWGQGGQLKQKCYIGEWTVEFCMQALE